MSYKHRATWQQDNVLFCQWLAAYAKHSQELDPDSFAKSEADADAIGEVMMAKAKELQASNGCLAMVAATLMSMVADSIRDHKNLYERKPS